MVVSVSAMRGGSRAARKAPCPEATLPNALRLGYPGARWQGRARHQRVDEIAAPLSSEGCPLHPHGRVPTSPMPYFICTACGAQFAESAEPPPKCLVCEDARQYVP